MCESGDVSSAVLIHPQNQAHLGRKTFVVASDPKRYSPQLPKNLRQNILNNTHFGRFPQRVRRGLALPGAPDDPVETPDRVGEDQRGGHEICDANREHDLEERAERNAVALGELQPDLANLICTFRASAPIPSTR